MKELDVFLVTIGGFCRYCDHILLLGAKIELALQATGDDLRPPAEAAYGPRSKVMIGQGLTRPQSALMRKLKYAKDDWRTK